MTRLSVIVDCSMCRKKRGNENMELKKTPPTAARKLADETGEPVEKFIASDEPEFPDPEELETVDRSPVE